MQSGVTEEKGPGSSTQVKDLIWLQDTSPSCPRALTLERQPPIGTPPTKTVGGSPYVGSRSRKVKDRELGVLKTRGAPHPSLYPQHFASTFELAPPAQASSFLKTPVFLGILISEQDLQGVSDSCCASPLPSATMLRQPLLGQASRGAAGRALDLEFPRPEISHSSRSSL